MANERKKALNAAKAAINSQGQGGGLNPGSQAYDQTGNVGNTSMRSGGFPEKTEKSPGKRMQSGNRRRRVRCKTCEACLGGDCKQCVYCKGKFRIFEVYIRDRPEVTMHSAQPDRSF